jgi:hypothetical protein
MSFFHKTNMENAPDDSLSLGDELQIPEVHEVFFQFDNDEPVKMAYVTGGEFSLTLRAVETSIPTISFSDGKGKEFKIFLKNSDDGIQQEDI